MIARYSPSSARAEYDLSSLDVKNTLKKVSPPRRVDPDIKNYILGASVLFLSANLENYISDLFKGVAHRACTQIRSAKQIPPAMLGWIFLSDGHLERSRRFVARGDEGDFIDSTGAYLSGELISRVDLYVDVERFSGFDDKSYPSVKNIKRMFRRVGIDRVFTLLDRRMHTNSQNIVKSLNSVRGSLAHTGISGNFSYGDIKRQVVDIERLVVALDKEMFYYLRDSGFGDAWPK